MQQKEALHPPVSTESGKESAETIGTALNTFFNGLNIPDEYLVQSRILATPFPPSKPLPPADIPWFCLRMEVSPKKTGERAAWLHLNIPRRLQDPIFGYHIEGSGKQGRNRNTTSDGQELERLLATHQTADSTSGTKYSLEIDEQTGVTKVLYPEQSWDSAPLIDQQHSLVGLEFTPRLYYGKWHGRRRHEPYPFLEGQVRLLTIPTHASASLS